MERVVETTKRTSGEMQIHTVDSNVEIIRATDARPAAGVLQAQFACDEVASYLIPIGDYGVGRSRPMCMALSIGKNFAGIVKTTYSCSDLLCWEELWKP